MSYKRLAEHGGLQWPCPDENDPGALFLHGRLWEDPIEGRAAPFSVTPHSPPVDLLDDEYPIRLTTGRRLESYNTGAQTNVYNSPLHRGESLDLSPEDAASLASTTARSCGSPRDADRSRPRRGSTPGCARASRS